MSLAVMCCGCRRFLGKDGSPIRCFDPEASAVADFPDNASADAAAKSIGWQVADAEGPNHRCPDCVAGKPVELAPVPERIIERWTASNERGAYVDLEDLRSIS